MPALAVDAAAAWPVLLCPGNGMPRTARHGAWPDRRQARWVARTALMNWPDIVTAEPVSGSGSGGAGLLPHSRSLSGWSDFGTSRGRVAAWLAALDAALCRR